MASRSKEGQRAQEGDGGLFQGKKFWLSRRVPLYNTYVEKIKANGGDVVEVEGRADILVADHLKPLQAPSNSVSYRFIDESIKRGELASLDEHRIGRPAARPAGSTRMPGKATRTPFTSEDDKILREWVIQRARIGEKVSGNNIYQKLAQQHPHHTWQSWRDHWVKKVSHTVSPEELYVFEATSPRQGTPQRLQSTSGQAGRASDGPRSPARASAPAAMRARAAPPTPSRRAAQTPTSPVRRSARVAQAETGSAEPIGQQVEIEIPVTRARQTVLKQQPKRQSRARAAPEGAQAESEAEAERAEPVLRLGTPTPDDEEVQFYKDLNDYRSHSGDLEGFIPEINGKKLALWPLFSAATSQPVPHRDRDWRKVAETLGIDWRANEEILEQLERCYEQNLLDFEIKMREFEEGDDESSVEREDESSVEEADEGRRDDESGTEPTTVEVTVEQQETVESVVTRTVTAVPAGEASASKQPTPTSARKRAVDDEARIEPGAGSRGKRRRLSPQHETPQTPERHERQSKGKGKQKESATAFVEPETQDFRYDVGAGDEPETQDFGYVAGAAEEISAPSDDVEMTPSQQLRSEASAHRSSPAAQRQDGGAQRQPARANSPPSVDSSDEDAFDPPRMAIRGRTEPDQQPTRPRPAEQQQAQPKQPVLSPPAEITPASRPSPQREAVTAQSAAPASLQTTPPPREASASPSSGLDEYHAQVDHYVSLGYPYAIVRQAMLMTTFHPGPAAVVMEALRSGAPIPEARYIWTAQDDSALRAYVRARDDHKIRYPRDILVARRFERAQVRHAALVNKHGAAAVEERETFLRNLDAHEKEVERKAAAEARQSVSLARSEKDLKGLIASAVGPGVSGSLRRNG